MKQNFFDHLDGGWGDLIADTYKEANDYTIVFEFTNLLKLMEPTYYEDLAVSFYANLFNRTTDIEVKSLKIINIYNVFDIKNTNDGYVLFKGSKQFTTKFTTTFSNILINNDKTYSEIFKSYIKHPYPYKFKAYGRYFNINSDEDVDNIPVVLTFGYYKNKYSGEITSSLLNNIIISDIGTFENKNYSTENMAKALDKYKKIKLL